MNIKRIIKINYKVDVKELIKLDGGFRNECFKVDDGKRNYIFIIYKKGKSIKSSITNAHFVAEYLKKKSFPTRVPIQTENNEKIIQIECEDGMHFASLYNYLSGETIPWEAYTRRHIKSIGKTLSDMHFYLRNVDIPSELHFKNWKSDTIKEIKLMRKYFKDVEPWIEKKLKVKLNWNVIDKLFQFIKTIEQHDKCILHYDFVRGNILFSDRLNKKLDTYPICGILDFEKVCLGPKVADIARTLAFLIIDCKYKNERTVRKRFLKSGYRKRGKSDFFEDSKKLDMLIHYFWLRDFWKFLVHNPYEYLHMNEHYKRTAEKLLKKKYIIP